jgi:hypothetical protein
MENPESDSHGNEREGRLGGSSDFPPRPESDRLLSDRSGLRISYVSPDNVIGVPAYVFEGEYNFRRVTLEDERDYLIASVAPEEPGLASIYKIDPKELPEPNLINVAGACEADNLLAVLRIGESAMIELIDHRPDFTNLLMIDYCSADNLVWED